MSDSRKRSARGTIFTLCALAIGFDASRASADVPLGVSPVSHAEGTSAAAPPEEPTQASAEASVRFKRALQLFDEGDYTLALVEFERAYELAPNYRALYNIALVNMQLARYADAVRALEKYVQDGGDGISPERRAEVQNSLKQLLLRTATVDLSTNVISAEVSVDGKPIEASRRRGPMLMDAGEHTFRAAAPGFQAAYRTVNLAGSDVVSVRLQLVPISTPRQNVDVADRGHAVFWPGFVGAGALGATAIVSGIVMLDARSTLTTLLNTPQSDPAARASAANRTNSAALVADIFSGLAIVTCGVSVYVSLRPDRSSKGPKIAISPQRIDFSGSF